MRKLLAVFCLFSISYAGEMTIEEAKQKINELQAKLDKANQLQQSKIESLKALHSDAVVTSSNFQRSCKSCVIPIKISSKDVGNITTITWKEYYYIKDGKQVKAAANRPIRGGDDWGMWSTGKANGVIVKDVPTSCGK